MTLKEAKAYMISNPGVKFTCQVFHNEWIMFDGTKFIFEDGYQPDLYWWTKAMEWGYDWWVKEPDITVEDILNGKYRFVDGHPVRR